MKITVTLEDLVELGCLALVLLFFLIFVVPELIKTWWKNRKEKK